MPVNRSTTRRLTVNLPSDVADAFVALAQDRGLSSSARSPSGAAALANAGARRRTGLVSRPDCGEPALSPRYPLRAGPAPDRAIPSGGRARTTPG